jgi:hypothetical protein
MKGVACMPGVSLIAARLGPRFLVGMLVCTEGAACHWLLRVWAPTCQESAAEMHRCSCPPCPSLFTALCPVRLHVAASTFAGRRGSRQD